MNINIFPFKNNEKNVFANKMLYNIGDIRIIPVSAYRPGGEIGRRRGLKIPRRKVCRFESDPGHQIPKPESVFMDSGFFMAGRSKTRHLQHADRPAVVHFHIIKSAASAMCRLL